MNSDFVYGIIAIALAVVAFYLAPQLWEMSGNEEICGATVPEDSTNEQCKNAYDFYEMNENILNLAGIVFCIIGVALVLNGFRD